MTFPFPFGVTVNRDNQIMSSHTLVSVFVSPTHLVHKHFRWRVKIELGVYTIHKVLKERDLATFWKLWNQSFSSEEVVWFDILSHYAVISNSGKKGMKVVWDCESLGKLTVLFSAVYKLCAE